MDTETYNAVVVALLCLGSGVLQVQHAFLESLDQRPNTSKVSSSSTYKEWYSRLCLIGIVTFDILAVMVLPVSVATPVWCGAILLRLTFFPRQDSKRASKGINILSKRRSLALVLVSSIWILPIVVLANIQDRTPVDIRLMLVFNQLLNWGTCLYICALLGGAYISYRILQQSALRRTTIAVVFPACMIRGVSWLTLRTGSIALHSIVFENGSKAAGAYSNQLWMVTFGALGLYVFSLTTVKSLLSSANMSFPCPSITSSFNNDFDEGDAPKSLDPEMPNEHTAAARERSRYAPIGTSIPPSSVTTEVSHVHTPQLLSWTWSVLVLDGLCFSIMGVVTGLLILEEQLTWTESAMWSYTILILIFFLGVILFISSGSNVESEFSALKNPWHKKQKEKTDSPSNTNMEDVEMDRFDKLQPPSIPTKTAPPQVVPPKSQQSSVRVASAAAVSADVRSNPVKEKHPPRSTVDVSSTTWRTAISLATETQRENISSPDEEIVSFSGATQPSGSLRLFEDSAVQGKVGVPGSDGPRLFAPFDESTLSHMESMYDPFEEIDPRPKIRQ